MTSKFDIFLEPKDGTQNDGAHTDVSKMAE